MKKRIAWKSLLFFPFAFGCMALAYGGAVLFSQRRLEAAVREADTAQPTYTEGAFYKNTLTAREQMLYEAMETAASALEEETALVSFPAVEEEFQNALSALLLDDPALFYIIPEETAMRTSEYSTGITIKYRENADTEIAVLASAVAEITETVKETDAYGISLSLHDVLTDQTTYPEDTETVCGGTAYDALVLHYANGYGYAAAYQLLCETMGIEADTVCGTVSGADTAWNCVRIDGNPVYTDVLWDDCRIADTGVRFHGYFALTLSDMSLDHTARDTRLWEDGTADDYYTHMHCAIRDSAAMTEAMTALLAEARRKGDGYIEFSLGEKTEDAVLEQCFHTAVKEANAIADADGMDFPPLRSVNRIYYASETRPVYTVRLYYDE